MFTPAITLIRLSVRAFLRAAAVLNGVPPTKSARIRISSPSSDSMAFAMDSFKSSELCPISKLTASVLSGFPATRETALRMPSGNVPCPVTMIPVMRFPSSCFVFSCLFSPVSFPPGLLPISLLHLQAIFSVPCKCHVLVNWFTDIWSIVLFTMIVNIFFCFKYFSCILHSIFPYILCIYHIYHHHKLVISLFPLLFPAVSFSQ